MTVYQITFVRNGYEIRLIKSSPLSMFLVEVMERYMKPLRTVDPGADYRVHGNKVQLFFEGTWFNYAVCEVVDLSEGQKDIHWSGEKVE